MRSIRLIPVTAAVGAFFIALAWTACAQSSSQPDTGTSNFPDLGDGAPANWVDCVSALHVTAIRDYGVANAERVGDTHPEIEAGARVSDLASADLAALCDWEACLRTNGYGHICYVNDAGWEQCRGCDSVAECGGLPTTQADCVAHAGDPGVATCHVVLLEECLLQRAIRLPTDPRVTVACFESAQACAGQLPGDLSAQAVAARHETDQVAVEQAEREFTVALESDADPSAVAAFWEQQFCMWEGGHPEDLDGGVDGWGEGVDAFWCATLDGGSADATIPDGDGPG